MIKLRLFITVILFLFSENFLLGQTIITVQDKANNGQLKRMVFNEWNDWQPDPSTNWLGLPKDPAGWAYWRVLHHKYWNGEDKRPWKTGGQFQQNYVALLAQKGLDKKILDTTSAMMKISLSTELSMSGGAADVPYQLYFNKKFDDLFQDVMNYFQALQTKYPAAFNDMINSANGKKYVEFLDVEKDRVETIHGLFVDRGSRMVSYFKILSELQPACEVIKNYVQSYMRLASMPQLEKVHQPVKPNFYNSGDANIVRELLKNWKTN